MVFFICDFHFFTPKERSRFLFVNTQ